MPSTYCPRCGSLLQHCICLHNPYAHTGNQRAGLSQLPPAKPEDERAKPEDERAKAARKLQRQCGDAARECSGLGPIRAWEWFAGWALILFFVVAIGWVAASLCIDVW